MNVKKTKSSKKIVLKITMSMTDLWFDRDGSIRILSIDSERSCVVNVRELVPISWTDVGAFNL